MRAYIIIFVVVFVFTASLLAAEKVVIIPLGGKNPSGTATQSDVLEGKTFSSDVGIELYGSMTNNGAITITPSTSDQVIPKGFHNGLGSVKGDPNLISDNIRSGTTIFDVPGSIIGVAGTATSLHVATGQSFSNENGTFTGSRGTFWGCRYKQEYFYTGYGYWILENCITDCTTTFQFCQTCPDCDSTCNSLKTIFDASPILYQAVCSGDGGGF